MKTVISNKKSDYITSLEDLEAYRLELISKRSAYLIMLLPVIDDYKKYTWESIGYSPDIKSHLQAGFSNKVRGLDYPSYSRSFNNKNNKGRHWSRMPPQERVNLANSYITLFISERLKSVKFHLERGKIVLKDNKNDLSIVKIRKLENE